MTAKTISTVAIIKCPRYDPLAIEESVTAGFELLGGYRKFFSPDDKILLKPNMLSAKKPEVAVTTHPEFLRGVIRFFKKNLPAAVMVGDSPGGAVSGTRRVWDETGIGKVCDEEQVIKLSFEKSGVAHIAAANPRNKRIPVLELAQACLPVSSDGKNTALVSLPKMKTHTLMLFTGAIKNLYGCVPGLRKAHYHFYATHPDDFAQMLADLMYHLKPRFAITDAIVSMEGEGPSAGKQRQTGLIVMGDDLVAVDTVLGSIMGFDTSRDPTLNACKRMGLGNNNLKDIEVVTYPSDSKTPMPGEETVKEFFIPDFKKPSNLKVRLIPRFLGPIVKKIFWAKPRINPEICSRCRLCMNSCPARAIFTRKELSREVLVVNKSLCIECMCCHELCPDKAIDIEYSFLADILTRRSSSRRKNNL